MATLAFDYCSICDKYVRDGIAHFLYHHPPRPVPREIVLDWVRRDPNRCRQCYRSFSDVDLHYQLEHVPSVLVHLGWNHYRTVLRGEDGTFACPFCYYTDLYSDSFKVILFVSSVRQHNPTRLSQEHAERCAHE